ncbi:MAG TPA: hypothetical protein VIX63_08105, partial [Vicinamibacterales bacterium]
KWPQKYNGSGHLSWAGRIYSRGLTRSLDLRRGRIYHGTWGAAPFQRLYQPAPSTLYSLSLMPEWYLAIPLLLGLSLLGAIWAPLLFAVPLLALTTLAPVAQAWLSTRRASFSHASVSSCPSWRRFELRLLTAVLHVMHPLARLCGRVQGSCRAATCRVQPCVPRPRTFACWVERGHAPEQRLHRIEEALRATGAHVRRGGDWDCWDLEVAGGVLGAARLVMAVEDHGGGNQFVRSRWWPRLSRFALAVAGAFLLLSLAAALDGGPIAAAILGAFAICLLAEAGRQAGIAAAIIEPTVRNER